MTWRKTSFSHPSDGGWRFVKTLLTVGGNLRLQGRPTLLFVRSACEAWPTGTQPPTLLPDTP